MRTEGSSQLFPTPMGKESHGVRLKMYTAVLLAGLLGVDLVNKLLLLIQPVLSCPSLLDEGCLPLPHVPLGT